MLMTSKQFNSKISGILNLLTLICYTLALKPVIRLARHWTKILEYKLIMTTGLSFISASDVVIRDVANEFKRLVKGCVQLVTGIELTHADISFTTD